MPAGPLALAGIQAGAQIVTQGIGALATGASNRKQRKWNEKMYNLQRQHALDDWNMTNAYNSPEAQMARYEAAGLNKHLIYGQTNESPTVRSTDVKSWNPNAIDFDLAAATGQGIAAYQDARIKDATIDNMTASLETLQQEAKLKAAQTIKTMAETDRTRTDIDTATWELAMKNQMAPFQLSAAQLQNEKTAADIMYTKNSDARAALTTRQALQEGLARIAAIRMQNAKSQAEQDEIRVRTQNLIKEGMLKEMELEARRQGRNWNANALDQFMQEVLQKGRMDLKRLGSWIRENLPKN